MELRLIDAQQILDVDFGRWLIPFIKTNLIANYSNYSFVNWETFLNETEDIKRLYNKKYRVFDILKFASNNLICDGIAGEVHIHFNNNIYVPGFDRWKLTSAIKTINFGTLDIKGCPIFTDTLDEFASKINTYIGIYYNM